jgi:para-aminobenzoate synthetase/4-amino-4-deoxychorismate lyase
MLWQPGEGIFLLDRHLRRLADSAEYFGFPVDSAHIEHELATAVVALPGQVHRVRLLVDQNGSAHVDVQTLPAAAGTQPVRLGLAIAPVDREDVFLYHKTTRREIYSTARDARPDCDDVLLWNEQGEITETCIANVAVRLDGELVTPPVDCGLLAGTLRAELLDAGVLRERVLRIEDLARGEAMFVFNSVRGWRRAELIADETVQDVPGRWGVLGEKAQASNAGQ